MTDFASLGGRAVVVTGAGRGLGLAISRTLAEAGAVVHVVDVVPERVDSIVDELAPGDRHAVGHVVDIADEHAVARLFETIDDPIWGLVNNAAMADAVGGASFWELDLATWNGLLAVNLTGTWLVSKHAAPRLIENRAGRIVNMASDAALYGSPRLSHYIASKGAVIALTRAMARELGPFGITVNAVAPGIVEGASTTDVPAERHQLYADGRALDRPQQPHDVVGMVRFLLSDEAAYVTGATHVVDGGFVM